MSALPAKADIGTRLRRVRWRHPLSIIRPKRLLRNLKLDEINEALKQEHARREAAIKNLYRLRVLRLARDAKLDNPTR